MSKLYKKNGVKKKLYSTGGLIVALLVTVFVAQAAWNVYQKKEESATKLEDAQKKALTLEGRRADLEEDIQRLNSKKGIEEEIRDKFNVAKEGEETVIIVEEEKDEQVKSSEAPGFFEKLWKSLTGWF